MERDRVPPVSILRPGIAPHKRPKSRMLGLQYPLLFDVAVPVDTAAFKKAVAHHALAKEKKSYCQGDKK